MNNIEKASITHNNVIYVTSGIIEIIFILRLFLKLVGADISNLFVEKYYLVTDIIVGPLNNVIGQVTLEGPRENMIFEPSNILAIIIVILICWIYIAIKNITKNKKAS